MRNAVIIARGEKSLTKARSTRYHLIQTNVGTIVAGCNQLDTLVWRWQHDDRMELPWRVHIIDTRDDNASVWDSTSTIESRSR